MRKFIAFPLFFWLVLSGCSTDYSSSGSSNNKRMAVCTYSQIEVKNKLKSPSSAVFPGCSSGSYTELGGDKYSFKSYVEAQNSFGASVKNDYTCTVTLTNSDAYYVNCSIL